MDEIFEDINSPQFFDFECLISENQDSKTAEAYFDVDHERSSITQSESSVALEEPKQSIVPEVPVCEKLLEKEPTLAKPKYQRRRSRSVDNGVPKKKTENQGYESVAKLCLMFQQRTPARYHTVPVKTVFQQGQHMSKPRLTIAQSPKLATSARSRSASKPTSGPIKAVHELKIAHEDNALQKQVKPLTITKPEPFSFYERTMKKVDLIEKKIEKQRAEEEAAAAKARQFRANPIKNGPIAKKTNTKKAEHKEPTMPKPFSFEDYDRKLMERKEKKIQAQLEEEKRLREFKAKPIPKCIRLSREKLNDIEPASIVSKKSDTPESPKPVFKARPASVLLKPQWKPVLEHRVLTEVQEFNLNVLKRAERRREFEEHIQEREAANEQLRQKKLAEDERQKELELKRIREEAIVKAQPIRAYKPLPKVEPKDITIPQTPKLVKALHRGNKENS